MWCRPSWLHVNSSKSSSSVPVPPGSATTASDSSAISALRSCIVSTTRSSVRPRVGDLALDEPLRDDADHLAAGGQRAVGHRAHQPDARAAVDDAHAPLREQAPERRRGRRVFGPGAGARATEDDDALHDPQSTRRRSDERSARQGRGV